MKRSTSSFLFKQGLREIGGLWKQFLAIIAIGAIAVTLFVGLQANADSLAQRVDRLFEAGNLADSYVTVNPAKGNQGDLTEIKSIVGGEADVEGRFYAFAKVNTFNAYCGIGNGFPSISHPSEIVEGEVGNDYFLVDSLLLKSNPEKDGEGVVIGEEATVKFDFSSFASDGLISDSLLSRLDMESYLKRGVKMEDTPLKTGVIDLDIPVTGVMKHPENVTKASYSVSLFLLSSSAFAKAFDKCLERYFTDEGVETIYALLPFTPLGWNRDRPNRFPVANQFLIKGKEGFDVEAANEKIRSYFDGKLEEDKNLLLLQKKEETSFALVMETDVTQARQLTYVFPFVFFIVGILVILTTMSQLILKERTQIGTLKALGLSKWSIQAYYATITSAVVGLGILIGEILGPILLPWIMDHKYSILYSLPPKEYVFPVLSGILTAAVFIVAANLVTFLTCRKECSLLPVESMRPAVHNFGKKTAKKKKETKNRMVFSLLMAKRNIVSNLPKSSMVVLGILGCTALLCCGFGIDDTINHGIGQDPLIENYASLDITCVGDFRPDRVFADLEDALGEGSILKIQGYTSSDSTVSFGNKEMSTFARVFSPSVSATSEEGDDKDFLTFDWDKDKLLLTKKVAERVGAKIGDTISFTIAGARIEGEVGAIRDIFYSNGVYVSADSSLMEGRFQTSYSFYYVRLRPDIDVSEAKNTIKSKISYVGSANTEKDYRDMLEGVMSNVSSMTQAVKIFAILLALVVLYNISLLNFKERSRDIATMKVLGFNRVEIAASLLFETMTLTLIGVVLGLFAGFPFLYLVMYINQVEIVSYAYYVSPLSYFLAFLLTFVVAAIINAYLASRTNKIRMVESLKSVE